MTLSATIDAMVGAGCTAEQVAAVVRVHSAADEQKKTDRRTKDADRKRRQRALSANVTRTDADSAGQGGTPQDAPSSLLSSPTPPTNNSSPQSSLRSDSVRLREQFDRFMAAFPKRTNRKAAWAKFQVAVKAGVDPERIIIAAGTYAGHVKFTDPQFIKAPDAWLNAGKYDDELPAEPARPPPARAGPNGHRPRTMTELASMEFTDEPSPNPQTEPKSPKPAEPTVLGFAGRLSQPDRDEPGGKLLDLGQAGARWRA